MSPISSRNRVPPSASSKRPARAVMAPVNAPFSWPNSSLSSRSAGIAPQFTGTNGRPARADSRWMERATSSLPVPDSPRISTLASDGATWLIRVRTRCTCGLMPTSGSTLARRRRCGTGGEDCSVSDSACPTVSGSVGAVSSSSISTLHAACSMPIPLLTVTLPRLPRCSPVYREARGRGQLSCTRTGAGHEALCNRHAYTAHAARRPAIKGLRENAVVFCRHTPTGPTTGADP